MPITFWDSRGIVHWQSLEKEQSTTADPYRQILHRVKQKLRNRRIPVILLHDNAKPHTAKATKIMVGRCRLGNFWSTRPQYSPAQPGLSPK